MIVDSTPSHIRMSFKGRTVTFPGEWSSPFRINDKGELEATGEVSRFYLDMPTDLYWDPPNNKSRLSSTERSDCLDLLLNCAAGKGWAIVLADERE